MNINVTKPTGVICKTQGKYCAEDITVVPVLEEKSATPTQSAQEIVPSAGNCGISKVNIGAVQAYQGTATPAKSEQTINPTSGKFFSSFKVGAIPSDYVIPSGTLQITENGEYDVSAKASVNVNVPSGVEEVATSAAMDALLVEANVGKYYKFTGTTDSNYTNGDLYLVEGGAVTNLISFTIAGTSYQAEEGMTWEQWVNSSYNTGGFYVIDGNNFVYFPDGSYVSTEGLQGGTAEKSETIVANGIYYIWSSGGGAN